MSNTAKALGLGILGALAGLAGLYAAHTYFQPSVTTVASGTLLPQPRPIPDFQLLRDDGTPLTRSVFDGHWSVVFVGFTHCPDICPNTLGLLKTVHRRLAEQRKNLQVLFLSIDPDRDTPEAIGNYVRYFDPGFIGATGPTAELDRLGTAMGFVFIKVPGKTPDSYSMDHSAALILVDPQGRVAGYFTPPLKIDALVADFARLLPDAA